MEKKCSILTEQRSDRDINMRNILLPDAVNKAWDDRLRIGDVKEVYKKLAYGLYLIDPYWTSHQIMQVSEKALIFFYRTNYIRLSAEGLHNTKIKTNDYSLSDLLWERYACQTSLDVQMYRINCNAGTTTN